MCPLYKRSTTAFPLDAVSAEGEKEKPAAAPTHRRSRSKGGTELPVLKPLPKSLTFDVK